MIRFVSRVLWSSSTLARRSVALDSVVSCAVTCVGPRRGLTASAAGDGGCACDAMWRSIVGVGDVDLVASGRDATLLRSDELRVFDCDAATLLDGRSRSLFDVAMLLEPLAPLPLPLPTPGDALPPGSRCSAACMMRIKSSSLSDCGSMIAPKARATPPFCIDDDNVLIGEALKLIETFDTDIEVAAETDDDEPAEPAPAPTPTAPERTPPALPAPTPEPETGVGPTGGANAERRLLDDELSESEPLWEVMELASASTRDNSARTASKSTTKRKQEKKKKKHEKRKRITDGSGYSRSRPPCERQCHQTQRQQSERPTHSLGVVTNRVEIQSESISQRRRCSHSHSSEAGALEAAMRVAIDEKQRNMVMVVVMKKKEIEEEWRSMKS